MYELLVKMYELKKQEKSANKKMRFLEKWKFSTKIPWKSVAHRGQIGQGLRSASRVGQYYGLQRVYSS